MSATPHGPSDLQGPHDVHGRHDVHGPDDASHGHDHDPAGHDDHGDDDGHDNHLEAPPPEPASPAWLPLLGGALFLVALIALLVIQAPDKAAVAADTAQPEAGEAKNAPAAARERPAPRGNGANAERNPGARPADRQAQPPSGGARVAPDMPGMPRPPLGVPSRLRDRLPMRPAASGAPLARPPSAP